jgi:NuA3 HAT complex component NTO1
MEIAKNGIARGSIRDLPPSKRFKFLNSDPGLIPSVLLPAKKRVFPPPPEAAAVAAVPACLPAKKRAIVAPPSEDAVTVCLPVKKRAYVRPADACMPACLPAKKRPYVLPPPLDSVTWSCVPAKKRVHAPPPQEGAAGSVPACPPAKNRVHGPLPQKDAAVPVQVLACVPSKKRVQSPPPRRDASGSVSVCLPTNKRVMPHLPSSWVESGGVRLGAVKKDVRPQGSNKDGAAAINPRLANGAEGGVSGKGFMKSQKPINAKEIKESMPMKPGRPRSPNKAKDPEKKTCMVPDVRQCRVEVCKKAIEANDAKQASRKEETRKVAEVVREPEQETVEDDDGVLCAVCRSTDGDPSDPIVFCDGCDLMVHASCYGSPLAQSIPDDDWFCSLCSAKKSKAAARPSCCLCPAKGGAMKRTTEGQWAHITCALLVPEVFFRDPDGRDGVDCSRVPAYRFAKECYICEGSNGCALECSQPKCSRGFHVSCGLDGGLCIEYREGKGGAIVAGFCREHTELWEKVKYCTTATNRKYQLAC